MVTDFKVPVLEQALFVVCMDDQIEGPSCHSRGIHGWTTGSSATESEPKEKASSKKEKSAPKEEKEDSTAVKFLKGAGEVALDFVGYYDAKAAITGVDEDGNKIGVGERIFRAAMVVPALKPVKGAKMAVKYGGPGLKAGKKNLDNLAKKGKKTACACSTVIKDGRITVEAVEANPEVFTGKSENEIADMLRKEGYDVTIRASKRAGSRARIIKINNPGGGKNITQVQVSPGGGRHGANPYIKISTSDQGIIKVVDGPKSTYKTDGAEKAKIIFTEGK